MNTHCLGHLRGSWTDSRSFHKKKWIQDNKHKKKCRCKAFVASPCRGFSGLFVPVLRLWSVKVIVGSERGMNRWSVTSREQALLPAAAFHALSLRLISAVLLVWKSFRPLRLHSLSPSLICCLFLPPSHFPSLSSSVSCSPFCLLSAILAGTGTACSHICLVRRNWQDTTTETCSAQEVKRYLIVIIFIHAWGEWPNFTCFTMLKNRKWSEDHKLPTLVNYCLIILVLRLISFLYLNDLIFSCFTLCRTTPVSRWLCCSCQISEPGVNMTLEFSSGNHSAAALEWIKDGCGIQRLLSIQTWLWHWHSVPARL